MSAIDKEYVNLTNEILLNGRWYEDKSRGVKRLQIPSYTFRHDFRDGFPALNIKELQYKDVVGELIWFLRGDNDVKYLNKNGIKIWNKDAYNWHVSESELDNKYPMTYTEFLSYLKNEGSANVGRNYSVQWRDYNGSVDQIDNLIKDMKENVMSTRLIVNAWNPSEIDQTALPPCHKGFQIVGVKLGLEERLEEAVHNLNVGKDFALISRLTKYAMQVGFKNIKPHKDIIKAILEMDSIYDEVEKLLDENNVVKYGFELHWEQRSQDTFLGNPYNVASYATLSRILEAKTGFKALAIQGDLKCVHFYENQMDGVEEMLGRDVNGHGSCELDSSGIFSKVENYKDFDSFAKSIEIEDFKLINYNSYSKIKVPMLAPIKV